jgi:hypothetical protein
MTTLIFSLLLAGAIPALVNAQTSSQPSPEPAARSAAPTAERGGSLLAETRGLVGELTALVSALAAGFAAFKSRKSAEASAGSAQAIEDKLKDIERCMRDLLTGEGGKSVWGVLDNHYILFFKENMMARDELIEVVLAGFATTDKRERLRGLLEDRSASARSPKGFAPEEVKKFSDMFGDFLAKATASPPQAPPSIN